MFSSIAIRASIHSWLYDAVVVIVVRVVVIGLIVDNADTDADKILYFSGLFIGVLLVLMWKTFYDMRVAIQLYKKLLFTVFILITNSLWSVIYMSQNYYLQTHLGPEQYPFFPSKYWHSLVQPLG